jgi:SAM-dependent methyltransferase
LVGSFASPFYWLLAHRYQVPGLQFQVDCALLGLRLLCNRKVPVPYREIYRLLFWPMNSARYFEFDFMWRCLTGIPIRRYLDVSSPQMFPILLIDTRRELVADLINPDMRDLQGTAKLVRALGLDNRCNLNDYLIGSAPFEAESFDLITSMSVVEHIPQDTAGVERMWRLLKPNGRLLLTVPCAAEALEEYEDQNQYGVLEPDEEGFYFFQRYYDQKLLQERIFRVTGEPRHQAVYGEITPGSYRKNEQFKISNPNYPAWREPYLMGEQYRYFKDVNSLPGVGVIGLEFVKP